MADGGSLAGVSGRLAIVGPTGSGKTGLVACAAREGLLDDVAVVSADAFAVYRGLEITAWAPNDDERAGVDYHLLGTVDVADEVSLAWFLGALGAIELERAGRGVLLVGGTSLWVRGAVNGVAPPPQAPGLRRWLEVRASDPRSVTALVSLLRAVDPAAAASIDGPNARRVVRALEVALASGGARSVAGEALRPTQPARYVQIGVRRAEAELRCAIEARVDAQLAAGWLGEVERILPIASRTARQAIGVRELAEVIEGRRTLDDARTAIVRRTWRLVRRQRAWLERDPRVRWVASVDEALVAIAGAMKEAA